MHDNEKPHLNEYKLSRADNASNYNRGGVGTNFSEFFVTRPAELNKLNEYIIFVYFSRNPLFVLVTSDFNAKAVNWWWNHMNTTEGNKIDSLTSFNGLSQIIFYSNLILPNFSCYIDFIFTNQLKLVIEIGLFLRLSPSNRFYGTQSKN